MMKINGEEVFIYESDGLGITIPRHVANYITKLEATVEAVREFKNSEWGFADWCTMEASYKSWAKLEKALEALDEG